jgi:hypothetical protein
MEAGGATEEVPLPQARRDALECAVAVSADGCRRVRGVFGG